jgi:hypothetical protein
MSHLLFLALLEYLPPCAMVDTCGMGFLSPVPVAPAECCHYVDAVDDGDEAHGLARSSGIVRAGVEDDGHWFEPDTAEWVLQCFAVDDRS